MIALAIDPGTRKCGVAIVENADPPRTLHRAVVPTSDLPGAVAALLSAYAVEVALIGDATNAQAVTATIRPLLPEGISLVAVPEAFTSERARARWCAENPPRTLWERLLPGFRTPDCPVDDYAAVILAESYFAASAP
ncbi:MAG: pre-16S rRNA-processing nuclease YqgF [Armatimonadetes bacterium]|nr:pre-16S rRNA-processing nuclease YqgF [Armatimonadota bacterium]